MVPVLEFGPHLVLAWDVPVKDDVGTQMDHAVTEKDIEAKSESSRKQKTIK
jgi:hypothetical protein